MSRNVIVIGGAGSLGSILIQELKKKSFQIISIDINSNPSIPLNIQIKKNQEISSQYLEIKSSLSSFLKNSKVSSIICTAGGWLGGKISDNNFFLTLQQMNLMNFETAALSSNLSFNYLENNGTLILTGSQAALNPCPNMIGYGISKSSTHYLIKSIVHDEDFQKGSYRAYGILPLTIDTPSNRIAMPTANFLSWTKVKILLLFF